MVASTDALQREVQELREENAALLEALRLAQRGDVDLRGHLSKFNPDATTLGIFSQDWELRYFVLSGTLLKYFSSERDVGIESARGVLDLQDCYVDVELPIKSTGPFIFQIRDPNQELLLRLSADNLKTAKTWVRTLAAAGLAIQGFERFRITSVYQGLNSSPSPNLELSSDGVARSAESTATGSAGFPPTISAPAGWGSKLGRALQSFTSFRNVHSTDSDLSVVRLPNAAAPAAAATRPAAPDAVPGIQAEAAASAFQQQQFLEGDGENSGDLRDIEHLKRMSTVTRSSYMATPPLTRAASTKRWGKTDRGDELPSPKESSDGQAEASGSDSDSESNDDEHQQQLASRLSVAAAAAGSASGSPNRSMPRADSSTAGPTQDGAGAPAGGFPAASAQIEASSAGSELAAAAATAAAASPSPAGGRIARSRKRQPMDGASPVHVGVKDSVLTWGAGDLATSRHEGLLNLGLVVLIATNLRMIMSNIFTYGLRLRFSKSGIASLAHAVASSRDDWITLAAVPGCLLFGFAALLIELLGLALLKHEQKLLLGQIKKDIPPAELRKQAAAAAVRHEWLLFVLNMANVGGSLVLPCWLVLSNQARLIAAFYLTMQSIITSMKLTTYAHCNTTLRHRTRRQHYRAALGKPSRSTSGAVTPFEALPFVTPSTAGATAGAGDLQTPFAAHAAGAGAPTSSTTGYNPDIATFFANNTVGSKNGQTPAQHNVTYPNNLNPGDLLYFLFAPTLTYQLNFPRIKKRRRRLLVKWCGMLVATGLLMGFMQVQFLLPLMQSSLAPLRELNMLRFTERLLRLSIPSLAHWVAMFFLVFHLFLNILGELLLFGDRVFYKEWWNAATLADYWKLWNIPFHKWMLRTVFFPLTRRGVSKFWSLMIVFFVSAVMHELAVGVPLRMLKGWAFLGMFLQVPLISLTEALRKRLKSDSWGNIIFWLSFCVLGQPMCLILYYHDWLLGNVGMQGIAQAAAEGAGAVASAAADMLTGTCPPAVAAVVS